MSKHILITGGAGYIGSHTCKLLKNNGIIPVTIDNLVYGHKSFVKWGPFYEGDIANADLVTDIVKKYEIKDVIHFAAFAYVGESIINPEKYFDNNLNKCLQLINTLVNLKVERFVFSSTCATYGYPKASPITEECYQNPINPYGETKLMIEKILKWYANSKEFFNFIALRYFNAAGADIYNEIGESHNPETHLIPLAINSVLNKNGPLKVFGTDYPTPDGTCIRDYIHVTDLADAHIRAIQYAKNMKTSNYFNLGTGIGHSVKEIINMVEKVSGKKCQVLLTDRRAGDPATLIADASKANKLLEWAPQFSDIETIIQTAWNWQSRSQ